MAYKLKRIGKKAHKFEYFLILHSLSIEVSNHKWCPTQVSIAFSRRGKRLYSKLLKWEPSINKPCYGYVVWPEPERMNTIVTLYKGQRDKEYESKEWELSVVDVSRDGKKKCLGRISMNMSSYAGDLIGSRQDMRLKLKPSGRKIKHLDLDCSLGSRFIRAGTSTDSDMRSQTSLMSVSQLSSISDMEGLDLTDFDDLDAEADDDPFSGAEPEVVAPSIYSPPNYIQQEDLLAWTQKCVEGYHGVSVSNFSTSWRSGLAFAAIIHHFHPDLLDFDSLQPHDVIHNNQVAFEAATSLGVPRIIQPENMESWLVPDRLLVTAFIYQLYIRLSPAPLSALHQSEPDSNIPAENSASSVQQAHERDLHRRASVSVSSPTSGPLQEKQSAESCESVHNTSPESSKRRRTLPPIPKHSHSVTPHSQVRVKDFLSALDHSPNKARPVSPQRLERNYRSSAPHPPSSSPFYGRKANRKQAAVSKFQEELPPAPNQDKRAQKPLVHTASMEMKFKQIDTEFNSQDLFTNPLLRVAEQKLDSDPLSAISPLEGGGARPAQAQETHILGRLQGQDSLLDILSDPCVIQEAKQQPRKRSLRQNKNPLINNPLYSSQESDLSSSDASVIDSMAAVVPSSLTQALPPRPRPSPKYSVHAAPHGIQGTSTSDTTSNTEDKETTLKKLDDSNDISNHNENSKIADKILQISKEDEQKNRDIINICDDVKGNESELKSSVRKKKVSLKKSGSGESIGKSEIASNREREGRGKKLDEVKARIKSRRKQNRKRPEVKQCMGEPTLVMRRYASVSQIDKMSEDDTFHQECSDNCLSDQEQEQAPSSYQHVLELEGGVIDSESSPRILQLYDARVVPDVVQNPPSVEMKEVDSKSMKDIMPVDLETSLTDIEQKNEKAGSLSLSEFSQNHESTSSRILCNEETDYVAHMQKKLCSMQISLDSRQAELRDRIREAEKGNNTKLHDSLLDKWFQLIQQKAHLDNRYDDLIMITETKDLVMKEQLLRKELEHKMQIDRSIKSREQLWEEDVLCGEIVQLEKERKEIEAQSLPQLAPLTIPVPVHEPAPTPTPTPAAVSVPVQGSKPAQKEPTKKGQPLGWRDKLLNILA